jgi:hypothetical protein
MQGDIVQDDVVTVALRDIVQPDAETGRELAVCDF